MRVVIRQCKILEAERQQILYLGIELIKMGRYPYCPALTVSLR